MISEWDFKEIQWRNIIHPFNETTDLFPFHSVLLYPPEFDIPSSRSLSSKHFLAPRTRDSLMSIHTVSCSRDITRDSRVVSQSQDVERWTPKWQNNSNKSKMCRRESVAGLIHFTSNHLRGFMNFLLLFRSSRSRRDEFYREITSNRRSPLALLVFASIEILIHGSLAVGRLN